jgi:phosphatidate phosphatase PAH1
MPTINTRQLSDRHLKSRWNLPPRFTNWRHQRDDGSLAALAPKHRGRKAAAVDSVTLENERLRKENSRLEQRLKQAELIIDIQKKVSQMLGITLATPPDNEID